MNHINRDRAKLKMIESLKEVYIFISYKLILTTTKIDLNKNLIFKKPKESPKERLERVWTLLRMSDSEKIDMAIKYCTSEYTNKLSMVREAL